MIFELGKTYIVSVTEKGIIPLMEFDKDKWYNKDYGDLDFLTDEEKIVVINDVLDKIRAEIEDLDRYFDNDYFSSNNEPMYKCNEVLQIIDKYREGSEGE